MAFQPSDEAECLYSPTDIFACDHGWRQVSWLAGRHHFVAFPGPRTQWLLTKDYPLTVAGAAAALGKHPRTAFPFHPLSGETVASI
ncbi:hypothetical protein ACVILJ_007973 [Bradyrhizobium diazoefficiens]